MTCHVLSRKDNGGGGAGTSFGPGGWKREGGERVILLLVGDMVEGGLRLWGVWRGRLGL